MDAKAAKIGFVGFRKIAGKTLIRYRMPQKKHGYKIRQNTKHKLANQERAFKGAPRCARHDLSGALEFHLTSSGLGRKTQLGVHLFPPVYPSVRVLDWATPLQKPRFAGIAR
jgi:hypothetical protein